MTTSQAPQPYDIAIIGMACRFPGAAHPQAFWDNLCRGVESVTFFTDEELRLAGVEPRLLAHPHYVKAAPVLEDHDGFDAALFGYAPREASLMDPQHRLFLEVAWEAFEAAGYNPLGEKGIVGVFAGAGGLVSSYMLHHNHPELRGQTGDVGHIGNDRDFLCSRVSYKLNLTGPSLNVQTACSTSLVAVHLACHSLLDGETDMALAGASVVRVPHIRGYLAEPGNIYALDGHCRAFDARGSGTLFGSGVAAVVLKPLAAALADNDSMYAVIKSSAINNDGGAKVSYSASATTGQARAMVEAMARAMVEPETIGYVECHGTATALGDPVEIQALTRAFRLGTQRVGFCPIGSVKTNVGHLEQCAGLAGLIKTVLVLHHGMIPPSLHFDSPNPRIPFDRSPFFVNTSLRPFARGSTPRRAAVNSVGMGGANACVILEEAPAPASQTPDDRAWCLLNLSAHSEAALTAQVANMRAALAAADAPTLPDVCLTLNQGRHHFGHRFSAVGRDTEDMLASLERFVAGNHNLASGPPQGKRPPYVFLFSGQGSQYARMGAALARVEPHFGAILAQCCALFDAAGIPLAEALDNDDDTLLTQTLYTQPALFALQMALTETWRTLGITPDMVIGHSIGEFAAAVVAGVCALEDAVHLVAARARLMQDLPQGGAMLSIGTDTATVRSVWPQERDDIAVAAENAPGNTVVAGSTIALAMLSERLRALGIPLRTLKVSHAFHSPLMAPMVAAFEAVAATVAFHRPRIPWISTLTGKAITAAPAAHYWSEQILRPVRFRAAVEAVMHPPAIAVEIGPGATLMRLGKQCLKDRDSADSDIAWVPSLREQDDELQSILEALRQLYQRGAAIRWQAVASAGGRRVSLPTYPFQHRRYGLEPPGVAADISEATASLHYERSHPFLGTRLGTEHCQFETLVALDQQSFLHDHRVFQRVVLPTTAVLDTVMAAAIRFLGFSQPVIGDFFYQLALTIPEHQPVWMRVTLEPERDRATFRLESTGMDSTDTWRLHVSGTVRNNSEPVTLPPFMSHAVRTCRNALAPEHFYRFLHTHGLSYGPAFQGIVELWRNDDEAFAKVVLPPVLDEDDYLLHPAFLDACLHIYAALIHKYGMFESSPEVAARPYVPISMDAFHLYRVGVRRAWVHAVVVMREGDDEARLRLEVRIYGEDGHPVALLRGVTIREATPELLVPTTQRAFERLVYGLSWREASCPAPMVTLPRHWYIFADATGIGEQLADVLGAQGCTCVLLTPAATATQEAPPHLPLCPTEPAAFRQLLAEGPQDSVALVYLWALRAPSTTLTDPIPTAATNALVCGACLHVIQALAGLRDQFRTPPRLWLVTRGAQSSADAEPLVDIMQSPLWGLGRTFALEYPDLWGGLIDLPVDGEKSPAQLLVREFQSAGDDQIVWREGKRLVPRLTRLAAEGVAPQPVTCAQNATYWIVGGLGRIGLKTAEALVRAGARHLILTGRQASEDKAPAALEALRRQAAVVVMSSDVTKEADIETILTHVRHSMPPLKGIIHAAAEFDDAVLANATWPQFQRVLAPKVVGAWQLHQCTRELDLDFFVLFSSVLSLWGAVGQGAYTAANSFLDALAAFRRAVGLPATVCNWGPWAEVGLDERWGDSGTRLWQQRGTTQLAPEIYLQTLLSVLQGGLTQVAVADTHWPTFLTQFATDPPLYCELASEVKRVSVEPRTDDDARTDDHGKVIDLICQQVSQVLGLQSTLTMTQPLNQLGLDSLLAVNLANRLRQVLDVTVPMAMLLKGPSIMELAAELFPEVAPVQDDMARPQGSSMRIEGNGWLIFHRPNPHARVRVFCFPFAGGGATTFRSWTEHLDARLELVAIEPPGRQTRIDEPPIRDMQTFVQQLTPALLPVLDKPFAMYGHCLGALTLFETVRFLLQEHRIAPVHIFVSGARPPDQLQRHQHFETDLLERLLKLPNYDLFEPIYRQPDDVFGEVIRQFNIPATVAFLQDPELRRLLLPVIRAEFEMSSTYRYVSEPPWDIPITCITGAHDAYVLEENAMAWGRFTTKQFQLLTIDSEHFLVVDDDQFLIQVVTRELVHPL